MEFDVEGHLAAVQRTVSFLDRDGQPASAVTLSRSFATTLDDIWDAVTNGERIPRWFAPVSGNLELGGHYQVEGNAGGTITACERLSHFTLTWEFAGDVSWVEVRLSGDESGSARLTLTHTAHLSEHWDEFGPGAVGVGWELGLLGLALHINDPDWLKPDEEALAASPDARAFVTGSSESWGQAAIEAGTDPGVAQASAARTTAFYTGEPPASEPPAGELPAGA